MKTLKKYLFGFIMMILLVSCGFNNLSHIEDINGEENTTLNTLTNDDLLSNTPHALFNMSVRNSVNNKTKFSCDKFSGVSDLVEYTITKETTFKVNAKILKGNGDIFVYQKQKRVQDINFPYDGNIIINNVTGKISFRIAGESAKLEITIEKI
ncbi:MAG: hypothetical protein MR270_04095 [Erysipelotrichaceae bacterium]|nr:hypothetical protein [Erysipelotrichaceae bacterium]